ncbi:MAG: hypothetical protein A3G37_00535 [Omnitrophica WOR_2 bacterium RIFCSPLOWO2_12_FULL_46_30]|nr:MAG: hypothetical protein A3D27_01970 [Omnitrophica WOR_2 bacterium RIFCSPHIGHO2_02_FULL_46_37]OGX42545.1 MAG: hypothetical protein A3H41_02450 [Omnitrophica WOR_2 bacterium RIFCSPLOWO2_02_FULL_45_28]OGX51904.1 MAG: hypothetical protein A3G37_00535 [Omnitrophica WOR_2 bacterium RIFCSPLOWO2_12_FULL_46_30]
MDIRDRLQNKLSRLGLIAFGLVSFLFLLYFIAGKTLFKYVERLKSEFASSQNTLQEAQDLVKAFSNPQKALEDMEKKARELKEMGVTSRQLPRLIQSLALAASKLNINIISIRPREDIRSGDENLPAGVSKVFIELTLSCPYKLFAEYSKAVSELPVTFIVEQMSMEKKDEAEASLAEKKPPEKSAQAPEELLVTLLLSTYMVWEL